MVLFYVVFYCHINITAEKNKIVETANLFLAR